MILYDKNSTFLGMSQDELSILGYEDMEEFKSHFSDFADLFVEHPGYISKFKNFSWIDYILYSGAPNKSVILKHKSGTELESSLIITEVPLIQEINGSTTVYCVELGIASSTSNSRTKPVLKLPTMDNEYTSHALKQSEDREFAISTNEKNGYTKDEYAGDFQVPQKSAIQNYGDSNNDREDNFKIEDYGDNHIDLKTPSPIEEERDIQTDIKLKLDDDFVPKTSHSIKKDIDPTDTVSNDISIDDSVILGDNYTEDNNSSIDEIPILSEEFQHHIQIDEEYEYKPKRNSNETKISSKEDKLEMETLKEDEAPIFDESIIKDEGDEAPIFDESLTKGEEDESPIFDESYMKTESEEIELERVDFIKIAEDTGMDLGDIATFVGDFIKETKEYLANFDDGCNHSNIDFAKTEAVNLEGVASNLKMEIISNTLISIHQSSDEATANRLIKKLQKQIEDLEEQLF